MDDRQLPSRTATQLLPRVSVEDEINDAMKMGELFLMAGVFDVSAKESEKGMTTEKKKALMAVKILYGKQLGLSVADSLRLYIINGKVSWPYQLLLATIRRTPGYNYKTLSFTKDCATIEIFLNKESLGKVSFDTEDMQRSGGGAMWQKFPAEMKMSKCASKAVNALCPEIMGGAAYTPQDLDPDSTVGITDDAVATVEVSEDPKPAASSSKPKTGSPKSSAPPAPAPAATASKEEKVSADPKPEAAPGPTPAPATQSEPVAQATAASAPSEATDVDSEPADAPVLGEVMGSILEAGQDNGWTQANIQPWFLDYLSNNGVTCDSLESIQAGMTWRHVNAALEFVATNTPEA